MKRNPDLSKAISEIEAKQAARRARGKPVTPGAVNRLAQLKDWLVNGIPVPKVARRERAVRK